jgi:hypothetical protein
MLLAHVDDNNDDYYYYCLVKIPLTPEIARERIIGLIKGHKVSDNIYEELLADATDMDTLMKLIDCGVSPQAVLPRTVKCLDDNSKLFRLLLKRGAR